MKIFAVGDSFTAGSELMDHEWYTDHPGFCTISEQQSPGNRWTAWWENPKRPRVYQLFGEPHEPAFINARRLEAEQAYPKRLGDRLGIEVINQAVGGCSMNTIHKNLTNYLHGIAEDHIVLLQPTVPERWTMFVDGHWHDFLINHIRDHKKQEVLDMIKFRVLQENAYSWTMQWWISFYSCLSIIKANPFVKHFIVIDSGATQFVRQRCWDSLTGELARDDLAPKVIGELNLLESNNQIKMFPKSLTERIICPGGHFNRAVHDQLAVELEQLIKVKLN